MDGLKITEISIRFIKTQRKERVMDITQIGKCFFSSSKTDTQVQLIEYANHYEMEQVLHQRRMSYSMNMVNFVQSSQLKKKEDLSFFI